jgi:hypothetical protein
MVSDPDKREVEPMSFNELDFALSLLYIAPILFVVGCGWYIRSAHHSELRSGHPHVHPSVR